MTADAEELAIARFHRGIQAKMAVGEALAAGVALAAERIANTLLGDGHLLIVGLGCGRHLAALLHQGVAHGFGFARPALPALLLEADGHGAAAEDDPLAARLRALGRPQDCLALIVPDPSPPLARGVLRAAHSRDLPCIVLCGEAGAELALATPDIELSAAAEHQTLTLEIQLSVIFALCELIERHLFGGSAT
jgi:D-sedoheptulose 7-phosphate isomerase